jgi:hypothetical protein
MGQMRISGKFLFSFCLFTSSAFCDLDTNQFIIGAWGGPSLGGSLGLDANNGYIINPADTEAYRGIQNDHYNAINIDVTPGSDLYQIFDGRVGEPSIWVLPVTTGDFSQRYRLTCLSYFNLKTMVWDKLLGDSPNLYWAKTDQSGQPVYICGERGWFSESYFAGDAMHNELNRYRNLDAAMTDKILGYFLGDEPNTHPQTTATIFNHIDSVKKYEAARPGLVNLLPMNHYCLDSGGSSFATEAAYQSYVGAYANQPNVKVLSFDIYPIFDNTVSPATAGFWNNYGNNSLSGSRIYYFRNYDVFSSLKKPGQRFWAVIQGSRPDQNYLNFTPNEQSARFCLNTALLYGAQGIWWYCWYAYTSPYNIFDHPIRGTIAVLNQELEKMAPVLMSLTWINTVHGKATDPQSGETRLKTFNQETQVLKMSPSESVKFLSIGVFKKGIEKYLMVFNKDLLHTLQNKTITVSGINNNPVNFNKTTGAWESISFTKNNIARTTSFTLGFLPAEMKLIRLNTQ